MSLPFYADVHIRKAITLGLRQRGLDVLTAEEDNARNLPDPALLDRAFALGRVLLTNDHDLLIEAARRQKQAIPFAGMIFSRQQRGLVGNILDDLELIANVYEPEDMANQVVFLPL